MISIFRNFSIDRTIPVPMYYQISQWLIKLINNKQLIDGDILPSEVEIAEALGVGRSTVRQALGNLSSHNLIKRTKGQGTKITIKGYDESEFEQSTSLYQEIIKGGQLPITMVPALSIIDPVPHINTALGLGEKDKLIELCRTRYAYDKPVAYIKSYLSLEKYSDLLKYDFSKVSLYSTIENHYKMKIGKIIRTLKTGYAEQDISHILLIKPGDSLFLITTKAFSIDLQPVEYSVANYLSDMAQFHFEISRWIKK